MSQYLLKFTILMANIFLIDIGSPLYAQVNGTNIFTNGYGLNIPGTAASVGGYGGAASMSAAASMVIAQSEANINNQTAFSMYLDNRLKYTNTYFQNRQLNSYYRDVEEWQKNTRRELRAAGVYDINAIRYIYGIGDQPSYNTGYNMPYP